MHGGNQIGEKIFMMLLLELWLKCITNSDRMDLVETVKNFANRDVFGTEHSRSQWKLPINKESGMQAVSFMDWHVRKVMAKLSDLVAILFWDMDDARL
jgi:hypothetical protein